uniref:Peroxidase 1 (Fragments) n=1 Tax=Catharanthus roseus TaxID=4058 RepID=PER1_CATRO|nr:RecName: Full=Peroxidase 1 [Catharanthus roseus]
LVCFVVVVFMAAAAAMAGADRELKYLSHGGVDFPVPAGRLDGVVSR